CSCTRQPRRASCAHFSAAQLVRAGRDQVVGGAHLDAARQGPCHGAALCVEAMNAVDDARLIGRGFEAIVHVDPAYDEDTVLRLFDLTGGLRHQGSLTRLHTARLQRAP
ncbi:MAG TPA: hypothetical protein VII47_04155, partial [Actinomycetota bacterium]